jgi:transcription-repair coupling factor (superfamily II helicase)
VSTAIIGAGLDIPTANTIIINHPDKFGLADLYQLRGRVGRSNVRAYAHFLIPGEDVIAEQARKKLQAIQELSYLGAGFRLALRDLEIRGAGNMLGAEQSGHIEAVGFDLYVEMLEQTVAELKGEKIKPRIEPLLDFKVKAVIPEDYVENPDIRLSLYRKVAVAKDRNSLNELLEEFKDRFGAPPEETQRLIEIIELKILARALAVTRIVNDGGMMRIFFSTETPVTPRQLISIFNEREQRISFLREGGVEIDMREKTWQEIHHTLLEVMEEMRSHEL